VPVSGIRVAPGRNGSGGGEAQAAVAGGEGEAALLDLVGHLAVEQGHHRGQWAGVPGSRWHDRAVAR